MDSQAKKALFRAKLKAQKTEKRIDSPLVGYNEFDLPICQFCDVVLKSESQWDAHQASRKHHEAIGNMKANAARLKKVDNVKTVPDAVDSVNALESETHIKSSSEARMDALPSSSGLPIKSIQHAKELAETSALIDGSESKDVKRSLPEGFFD